MTHTQPITRIETTFPVGPQDSTDLGMDVKHRTNKTCRCLKRWSSCISITEHRAMSWLLTLYIPFYTNSWQQRLGLAFFSVFIAPWKLQTANPKVLRLCCYTDYRGSCSHPSSYPDRPRKHRATGQRIQQLLWVDASPRFWKVSWRHLHLPTTGKSFPCLGQDYLCFLL